MTWVKFVRTGARLSPFLSIRTSGQIGLNARAIKKYKINPGYVVLFYDAEQQLLGINTNADECEDGAAAISLLDGAGLINIRSFFHYYDIDFSINRKYRITRDEKTGYLVSDLKEPLCKT